MRDGETYVIEVTDAIREFPNPVVLSLDVKGTIQSAGTTEKYFSFTAPYDHNYQFKFENLSSSSSYRYTFTLYDEDGNEIDKKQVTGSTSYTVPWELEAGSIYYIGVIRNPGNRNIPVAQQPSRAVAAVVVHQVGFIALGRRRQRLRGRVVVVVEVVAAAEVGVGVHLLACRTLGSEVEGKEEGERERHKEESVIHG